MGLVRTLGISVFSLKKSLLELLKAALVSLSASHTAPILVSSLRYPSGNPFHLCCVKCPFLGILYLPSYFLYPVSSSFLVYPLICGSTSSSLSLRMDAWGRFYENLHVWKCHAKNIFSIYNCRNIFIEMKK